MKTGMIILLNLFLIISCGDPDCKDSTADHLFEIPIDVSPRDDTLRIGDTITVVSTFSSNVFDRNNLAEFKLEEFKFYPFFYINVIDEEPSVGVLSNDNLILDSIYSVNITFHSSGYTSFNTEYSFRENTYRLVFKLTLERRGLHFMNCGSDLGHRFIPDQNFPGKCDKNDVSVYFKMGNEENNNFHYMELAKGVWTNEKYTNKEKFKRIGGYCFYVAE